MSLYRVHGEVTTDTVGHRATIAQVIQNQLQGDVRVTTFTVQEDVNEVKAPLILFDIYTETTSDRQWLQNWLVGNVKDRPQYQTWLLGYWMSSHRHEVPTITGDWEKEEVYL